MSELETVAKAIYEASPHNKPFSLLTAFQRERVFAEARAAMAALASRSSPEWQPPHKETIAREIRRAMLDNPTDAGFNARAEKREKIADATADVIMALFRVPEQ